MKKILLAICLTLAVALVVAPVSALELYNAHLRGLDEGLAAGALPPAGLYLVDDNWFMPSSTAHGVTTNGIYHAGEANPAVKVGFYVNAPILLWSSGCKFLGADYAAAIAEPFLWTNTRFLTSPGGQVTPTNPFGPGAVRTGNLWGYSNTILVPYSLSWRLPCDIRFRHSLTIGFNDAQTSQADSVSSLPQSVTAGNFPGTGGSGPFGPNQLVSKKTGNAYLWAGNDDYMITPEIGLSWLSHGFNISGEFGYTFYTKDTDTNYQNGDEFWTDLTATYTCGKWTFGVGSAIELQIQNDKFNIGTGYMSQPNTKYQVWSAGPIVGYNFGPCSLMFTYNWQIHTDTELGGDWFNVRLVVPLGNPYPLGK